MQRIYPTSRGLVKIHTREISRPYTRENNSSAVKLAFDRQNGPPAWKRFYNKHPEHALVVRTLERSSRPIFQT